MALKIALRFRRFTALPVAVGMWNLLNNRIGCLVEENLNFCLGIGPI